jgi:hypothetical protein
LRGNARATALNAAASHTIASHDSQAHHRARCRRCGWGERNLHTGRVPLEIEHIDGDWTNNRTENLVDRGDLVRQEKMNRRDSSR